MKKGYTLVEVLGVLIILGLIMSVAVPSINSSLTSSKNKAYEKQIIEIKEAAKSWSLMNTENVPKNENDENVIVLLQLKLSNLIAYNFTNPITNQLFPDDMQISITKRGMNLFYNVVEDSGSSNEAINPNAPVLLMSGGMNQIVQINRLYKEQGDKANDK